MPENLECQNITDATISSSVGVGANDVVFHFYSTLDGTHFGEINDNGDTYTDDVGLSVVEKHYLQITAVVNVAVNLGDDYIILLVIANPSNIISLHLPHGTLAVGGTYIWYFDTQGLPYLDLGLRVLAIDEILSVDDEIDINEEDTKLESVVVDEIMPISHIVERGKLEVLEQSIVSAIDPGKNVQVVAIDQLSSEGEILDQIQNIDAKNEYSFGDFMSSIQEVGFIELVSRGIGLAVENIVGAINVLISFGVNWIKKVSTTPGESDSWGWKRRH